MSPFCPQSPKKQYIRLLPITGPTITSYILDNNLKHCSQMKLKTSCLQLCIPNLKIFLCTELVKLNLDSKTRGSIFVLFLKVIWLHLHYSALSKTNPMPCTKSRNSRCFVQPNSDHFIPGATTFLLACIKTKHSVVRTKTTLVKR